MRIVPLAAALLCVALPAMAEDLPTLSSDQEAFIVSIALEELDALHDDEGVLFAIEEQNMLNASLSARGIKALERSWLAGDSHSLMAKEILGRQESYFLHRRRELSGGLVDEYIVMDARGVAVAISDYTPHYYFGAEAKFIESFGKGAGAVHVSEPNRNDAAHRVQVEVTTTITSPATGEPIGALTVGIDVETALEEMEAELASADQS